MNRRKMIGAGVAMGTVFALVALAPFALMLLPNPDPVLVADLSTQMPGNYVITGESIYHVFPRAEEVEAFPADAPVVGPDAVFIVKYRQLAQLSAYTVWSFDNRREVPVERDVSTPKLLRLRPDQPLAEGRYYAVVARESIYGGTDYVYFSVGERGE